MTMVVRMVMPMVVGMVVGMVMPMVVRMRESLSLVLPGLSARAVPCGRRHHQPERHRHQLRDFPLLVRPRLQ